VSFLYTAVHGGRVGLMYPSSVQRQQADGTVRSFVKLPHTTATSANAKKTTAAASSKKSALNDEFPAECMDLPLLKEVLDKMPSIACLQAWARGEEVCSEASSDCGKDQNSGYPTYGDPESGGSSSSTTHNSLPSSYSKKKAPVHPQSKALPADRCSSECSGTMLRRKLDEVRIMMFIRIRM